VEPQRFIAKIEIGMKWSGPSKRAAPIFNLGLYVFWPGAVRLDAGQSDSWMSEQSCVGREMHFTLIQAPPILLDLANLAPLV
jgi:hypothetical protein